MQGEKTFFKKVILRYNLKVKLHFCKKHTTGEMIMDRKSKREQSFESVRFRDNGHVKVFINTEPDNFAAHWHIPLEVLMPLENKYTVECRNIRRTVEEREIALITPGAVHALEAPPKGKRMFIQADVSCFSQMRELDVLFSVLAPVTVIGREAPEAVQKEAAEIVEQIRRDYYGKEAYSEISIYAGLFNLLSLFGRISAAFRKEKEMDGNNLNRERFTSICEYIREHCTEQITLEQTAKMAGFSKYYFARLFRDFTGVTFYKYLNQQRIMRAQRFLADPERTVAEIAMLCGYESFSSFNRMFKQIKGCTPGQFRKIHNSPF